MQIADIVIVEIHVDEAPELAVFLVEMMTQVGVLRRQVLEELTDRLAFGLHDILFARVHPEGCGYEYVVCHVSVLSVVWIRRHAPLLMFSSSNAVLSSRSRQDVIACGSPLATVMITYAKTGHA